MSSEFNASSTNLKIVKTEMKPSGEAVQLVRPLAQGNKTSEEIVDELVHKFNYKTSQVKSTENELNTVQQAFGSNLAEELIKTYEGSNLVSDSQQDLVGEKYLAEQIRLIQEQQKTTSFLDKWSHLLYEGERDKSPSRNSGGEPATTCAPSSVNVIATATLGTFTSSPRVNEQPIASHFGSHNVNDDQGFTSQAQINNNIINVRRSESNHHQQPQIVDLQQLRLSASRNSLTSQQNQATSSNAAAHQSSAAPISYAHSQSGIHSRTLSELRLNQLQQQAASQQQQVQENNAGSTHFSVHVDSTAISSAPVGASVTAEASEYSFGGADDNHSRLLIQSQQKQHQQQQEEILAYAQAQALAVKRQQDQQYEQYDDEEGGGGGGDEDDGGLDGEACAQNDEIDEEHAQQAAAAAQYQSSVYNHSASHQYQEQQASHRDSSASSHRVYTPGSSSAAHQHLQESSSRNSRYSSNQNHHQSSVSASVPASSGSRQTKQHLQQPHSFLPQLSSSNLNSVSLEAYNSPQFKAMLEQLSKPITIPPEHINYPPDWPSQDKINLLAEPIYIPAPQPIVIPAPSVITLQDQSLDDVFNRTDLPEDAVKPTVTYYPSIASDQAQYTNFGIRQIDTNLNN